MVPDFPKYLLNARALWMFSLTPKPGIGARFEN